MKKDKLIYLIVATYIISFLLLVFQYTVSNSMVKMQLNALQEGIGLSSNQFWLFVGLAALGYAAFLLLLYYKISEVILLKVDNIQIVNKELLLVSLMLSESLCNVIMLYLLPFIHLNILRLVIPILGLGILGLLLSKQYSFKIVERVVTVRFFFYVMGLVVFIIYLFVS